MRSEKMTFDCNRSLVRVAACRRSTKRCSRRRGFTLLELLLVLSILVVIGGIAVVNFGGAQNEANINATKTQLSAVKNAVEMYKIRLNGLPETLDALRDGPSDAAKKAKWNDNPIMTEIPTDAWTNPLVFSINGNKYEIRSGGPDGQVNTEDDIVQEG